MKKGTVVCIIIMAASFVLSMILLFVSAALYIASGTQEIADRIRTGKWDDIAEKIECVKVDKEDGVKVDLPGIHVIVDDLGVDVYVVGVHVDMRDDEEEAGKEEKDPAADNNKEETKEKEAEAA